MAGGLTRGGGRLPQHAQGPRAGHELRGRRRQQGAGPDRPVARGHLQRAARADQRTRSVSIFLFLKF